MRKSTLLSAFLFSVISSGCVPTAPQEATPLAPTKGAIDYRRFRMPGAGQTTPAPAYVQPDPVGVAGDGTPTPPTMPTPQPSPPTPALGMLDWRVDFDAHVTTSPALSLPGWPVASDELDRVWAVVHTGGGWVLRAYYHIYKPENAPPDVCFDTPINGDTDNGAVALSWDGQTAYVATSDGTLYSVANQSVCDGQSHAATWAVSLGAGVSHTSPWIDSTVLYVADVSGRLHGLDALTHVEAVGFPATISASALRSTPVVWFGKVWIGDGAGQLQVVNSVTGAVDVSVDLCRGTCGSADAIYSSVFVDPVSNLVTLGVNGRLISVPGDCSATSCAMTAATLSSTTSAMWSSPSLDFAGTFMYVGFDNHLFKVSYPISADSTISSSATVGSGGDPTYPRSSPMVYAGMVFIGDGGGFVDRFAQSDATTLSAAEAATPDYGDSVDTVPVIDFRDDGNLYFGTVGTTGDSSAGSLIQITRSF